MTLSCIKKTMGIIKRVSSKRHSGFNFLNCFHYFSKENKRESQKKYEKIKVGMPSKDTKILEIS